MNLKVLDYLKYLKVHYISLNSPLNWSVFHSNLQRLDMHFSIHGT
jgi:hypothetical protein